MALPASNRTYTYSDYLSWDESERIELINGQPLMQSAPSRAHQEISGELFNQLKNFLRGKPCRVYAAPFAVRLFESDQDSPEDVQTIVEPDISVVCEPEKLDDKGCKGAPTFIAEVLSPSTERADRFLKLNEYQRAGVREYWIIDPNAKSVADYVLQDGRFSLHAYYDDGDTVEVSSLNSCQINLNALFDF